MTDHRYTKLADFYAALSAWPEAARRVAWRGSWDQELRFEGLLAALGPPRSATLLDVGCGLGDLYAYLKRRGYGEIDYTGLDLLPEMVEGAQRRHPQGRFLVGDLLGAQAPQGPFDFVLCSGALNVEVPPDHAAWLEAMLEAMWTRTRHTLAFNLLNDEYLDAHADEAAVHGLAGLERERLWAICRSFSPRLVLREDILPTDCFVWCMRGPSPVLEGWGAASQRPLDRAAAYLEHRLPERALQVLTETSADDLEVLNMRAVALLQGKRADEAEPLLQAVLARAPEQPEARRNLAVALTILDRREEALLAWQAVVHQDPSDDDARAALCRALVEAERLQEAIEHVGAIARRQLRDEIVSRVAQARAR